VRVKTGLFDHRQIRACTLKVTYKDDTFHAQPRAHVLARGCDITRIQLSPVCTAIPVQAGGAESAAASGGGV